MTGKEDSRNKRSWTRDYDNTIFGFLFLGTGKLMVDGWMGEW